MSNSFFDDKDIVNEGSTFFDENDVISIDNESPSKKINPITGDEIQPGQTHFHNPETGRTEALPQELLHEEDQDLVGKDMDTVMDALEGASQGATLGFAEEITSPFMAGIGMATGAPSLPDETTKQKFNRLAQTYRDVARERTKLAEERSPKAFTGGALVGGAAIPMGAAARGVGTLAKMGRGAVVGGIGGGVAGAGITEGGIPERLKGALPGAGIGAVIGAAIPGAVAASKSIKNMAKSASKAISETDPAKIFSAYKSGDDLIENLTANLEKLKDKGFEVTRGLSEKSKAVGETIKKQLEVLEASGVKKDIAPILNNRRKNLLKLTKHEDEHVAGSAKEILNTIDNYLYGKPTTRMVPKVSAAEVQLKEAQDLIKKYNKLQAKKVKEGLTASENEALEKLAEKKAVAEATEGFAATEFPKTYTSVEGKTVLTQNMMKEIEGTPVMKRISTLVKDKKPGPITIEKGPNGETILKFTDEATGKLHTDVIPSNEKLVTELIPETYRPGGQTVKSPKEISDVQTTFGEKGPIQRPDIPQQVSRQVTGLTKDLKSLQDPTVTGLKRVYSDLLSKYQGMTQRELMDQLTEGDKLEIREKIGELLLESSPKALDKKTLPAILGGFQDIKDPTKRIPGLREIAPDLANLIEKDAAEIAEKVRLGYQLDPTKKISTISPNVQAQLGAQFGGGSGIVAKGAKATGKVARSIAEISKEFVERDPAYLATMAKAVANTGKVGAEIARVLSKAASADNRGRRALLFGLMQNPSYREMINNYSEQGDVGQE